VTRSRTRPNHTSCGQARRTSTSCCRSGSKGRVFRPHAHPVDIPPDGGRHAAPQRCGAEGARRRRRHRTGNCSGGRWRFTRTDDAARLSGGAEGSGCMPEGRPATVLLLTDRAARLSGLNLTHLGAGRHSAITSSRVPTPQPHLRTRGRHRSWRRVAVVNCVRDFPHAAGPP
jgi:hypothetical protein